MSNSFFQFKQFRIEQDQCAMKVGTDGVLLGAWANLSDCKEILDIGTGTGLIALMTAQRCNANIDAVDIDKNAYLQAQGNVASSPFKDQISVHHASLQAYSLLCNKKYDLLISNPPFFNNSLKSNDSQRNLARHTDTLPLSLLLEIGLEMLQPNGRIALVLPFEQEDILAEIISSNNLFIHRKTLVYPTNHSCAKRILVELSTQSNSNPVIDKLVIEESRHIYTEEYIQLTKEFYLKM